MYNSIQQKICSKCHEVKPFSEFSARSNKDNKHRIEKAGQYISWCKKCSAEHVRGVRQGKILKKAKADNSLEKLCPRCKEVKSIHDFYPHNLKDPKGHSSHHAYCKKCDCEYSREWLRTHRRDSYKERVGRLLREYNLTHEEYDAMLAEQGGVCEVCKRPPEEGRPLCVDHCHTTDAVRGLLCGDCNRALGLLRDNPERIESLLKYTLERVLY